MKYPILITIALLSFFGSVHGQSNPPIATVDLGQLFNNYWKVAESQARFEDAVQKANEELEAMMAELQEADEEVGASIARANSPALSESARETAQAEAMQKREALIQREAEVNQYGQTTNRSLSEERQRIIGAHLEEIRGIVQTVAEEKGFGLVLNVDGGQVVYAVDSLDITDDVAAVLNADAPRN